DALPISLAPAGVLGNYNITYNTADFTIEKKDASVTPNAANKIYGSADPAFTGTLVGFLAADNVTTTYSRTAGESVAGSPYKISATLSPTGVLGNYNITYNIADFNIEKKDASVTPNAANKTYGNADPTFTGTLVGFLTADGVTASYSRTAGETVAGSPYTISATLAPAGVLGNYNITYNTAEFTINKRPATVTADDKNKTYGDANSAFTATITGTVDGDVLNYTLASTAVQFSNVGNYPITVTRGSNPNYDVAAHDGTLAVETRQLDITANNRSKTYGDSVTFAGTEFMTGLGQLVGSDTVTSVTLTSAGAA